jgi:hypothetical protein
MLRIAAVILRGVDYVILQLTAMIQKYMQCKELTTLYYNYAADTMTVTTVLRLCTCCREDTAAPLTQVVTLWTCASTTAAPTSSPQTRIAFQKNAGPNWAGFTRALLATDTLKSLAHSLRLTQPNYSLFLT